MSRGVALAPVLLLACAHGSRTLRGYFPPLLSGCRGGFKRIDDEETRRGAAAGRPREKLTDVTEMLAVANGHAGSSSGGGGSSGSNAPPPPPLA